MKKFLGRAGALILVAAVTVPCQAAKVIRCSGRSAAIPMSASILANQNYGDIVSATLEYGTTRATYSASNAPATGRIIFGEERNGPPSENPPKLSATIPLDNGDRLVLSPDELHVTVFDKNGGLVAVLGCGL
ncbi:MAG: hypothetical protein HY078_12750 [Elusimicrobia bacterium]|nr:hypothetical protein [Elusimicrobiota bacterium]